MVPDVTFLDRDGTLNHKAAEGRYVEGPAQVRLLPGVGPAVRALNGAGSPVVVVTNQRGVALGRMTAAAVDAVHGRLAALLAEHGAHVDEWLVCPHGTGSCDCRKPAGGLLRRALGSRPAARPGRCVVVGDAETDVGAGRAIGVPGVLLAPVRPARTEAVAVHPDLAAAVAWILAVPHLGEAGHGPA